MATRKRSLMVLSVFLGFLAWGAFFPTLTIGSDVQVGTADFGEVVVGSTSTIPLQITNTGSMSVILYLWFDNYSCSFLLDRQSDILLNPGLDNSITVNISWTPPEGSEGTTCSDTLNVFYGEAQTVLVTGTAVEASALPKDLTPDTISIGEYNTEVLDRDYEGMSISELISECATAAKNHGQFVSCVTHLTNELKKDGVISDTEKGAIQSCAVKARLAP
jgi:hypothetical protein